MSDRYQLNYDTYYNMTITNLEVENTNVLRQCTFKIPLDCNFGEIMFNKNMDQTVYLNRVDNTLAHLNVSITDRYGYPVYSNGSNMSFSLLVEYLEN